MSLLLRIQLPEGRRYYAGYDGKRPSVSSKGGASRMEPELCRTVLRQLESLGFAGYEPVDESDTAKTVELKR